jgi:predicted RND superfamily exporter protein
MFESVSDVTFGIAAVMQLTLSIDYSIMLLHRFQQEYELLGKKHKNVAMERAIVNSIGSVSGSALTTIVGLMVLLLMSFTIGRDIGLVLAKGVALSYITVFTVMPTLIMWSDKLLDKASKDNIKKRKMEAKGGAINV